jgi:hypothetical protein
MSDRDRNHSVHNASDGTGNYIGNGRALIVTFRTEDEVDHSFVLAPLQIDTLKALLGSPLPRL